MIINNKEILSEYWNSNTPNGYRELKSGGAIDNSKENITCGILIVRDMTTKEIQVYYGTTELVDGKEDRKFILEAGNKLPINHFIKFINAFKEGKK